MRIRVSLSFIFVFFTIIPLFSQNLVENGDFDQVVSGADKSKNLKKTFYISGNNFTKTISTSDLKPGMYILKIISNNNVESFKIVKQ